LKTKVNISLEPWRDVFPAATWLGLQAMAEIVARDAQPEDAQPIIVQAVAAAEFLVPGKEHRFFDYVRALIVHRKSGIVLEELRTVVGAFLSGKLTRDMAVQLGKEVEPVERLPTLAKWVKRQTDRDEALLVAPDSTFTDGFPTGIAAGGPLPAIQSKTASVAAPAVVPTQAPQESNPPEVTTPTKGDQPTMASIVQDADTLAAARAAAKRIRETYSLDEIKQGLKQFLPSGADPGKLATLAQEKAALDQEAKAIRKEIKRREVELQGLANVPQVDAEGKAIKTTVDQRKAAYEQSLQTDDEYKALQADLARAEGDQAELNANHESARDQLKVWLGLKDLVVAELMTIGGY
jgi:hypothetical protein